MNWKEFDAIAMQTTELELNQTMRTIGLCELRIEVLMKMFSC